jgi:hypothetical protein
VPRLDEKGQGGGAEKGALEGSEREKWNEGEKAKDERRYTR